MASDIAVFPGTHSVLWEQSVGIGLPCIFKYYRGMDHIDIGKNCMFLYKDDPEEIISVINKIIQNRKLYVEMKENAITKGKKVFYYTEISKKALQLT
jgi:hypothetical protein